MHGKGWVGYIMGMYSPSAWHLTICNLLYNLQSMIRGVGDVIGILYWRLCYAAYLQ